MPSQTRQEDPTPTQIGTNTITQPPSPAQTVSPQVTTQKSNPEYGKKTVSDCLAIRVTDFKPHTSPGLSAQHPRLLSGEASKTKEGFGQSRVSLKRSRAATKTILLSSQRQAPRHKSGPLVNPKTAHRRKDIANQCTPVPRANWQRDKLQSRVRYALGPTRTRHARFSSKAHRGITLIKAM